MDDKKLPDIEMTEDWQKEVQETFEMLLEREKNPSDEEQLAAVKDQLQVIRTRFPGMTWAIDNGRCKAKGFFEDYKDLEDVEAVLEYNINRRMCIESHKKFMIDFYKECDDPEVRKRIETLMQEEIK